MFIPRGWKFFLGFPSVLVQLVVKLALHLFIFKDIWNRHSVLTWIHPLFQFLSFINGFHIFLEERSYLPVICSEQSKRFALKYTTNKWKPRFLWNFGWRYSRDDRQNGNFFRIWRRANFTENVLSMLHCLPVAKILLLHRYSTRFYYFICFIIELTNITRWTCFDCKQSVLIMLFIFCFRLSNGVDETLSQIWTKCTR